MNMIHKYAISGTIMVASMSSTGAPIDPTELSASTTLTTNVTITASGTAPTATWEAVPGLTDAIMHGTAVGTVTVEPFTLSKVCFKSEFSTDSGFYYVVRTDGQSETELQISELMGKTKISMKKTYDTDGCSDNYVGRSLFQVTKVGDRMAAGEYKGVIRIASMIN
ncbi:hypothetical protein OFK37_000022 [Salmonella enterica]|nr:hypothetical protein [Salmonella enterica]EJX4082139.1 hypothetical protein [Salmonella enterica]EJX4086970.1 hypothetical protein [Salmonella enterica]EJX4114648.1 hypothetical protein [Salmonella enterica]EJX4393778.1 hypothetical protein [Salmonella enterica]